MENKKWGLLTSLAVGDACGAPFEFKPKEVRELFTVESYPNKIGTYTDDTQMSIAVALHTYGKFEFSVNDYAAHFWGHYQHDKERPGFSRRTRLALEEDTLDKFITSCISQIPRDTNGCVMRVLPIGYIRDVERVKQAALMQCIVTHPYVECIIASQFVALMAHYFIYRAHENLADFICEYLGESEFLKIAYAWNKESEIPCNAILTASFVYNNVRGNSMKQILYDAIEVGGDVDSTAAVSLGLASLNKDIINDLPDALYDNLENGKHGRDFLDDLNAKLVANLSN